MMIECLEVQSESEEEPKFPLEPLLPVEDSVPSVEMHVTAAIKLVVKAQLADREEQSA
jgi:hypothetical protein